VTVDRIEEHSLALEKVLLCVGQPLVPTQILVGKKLLWS
jgi:hypothetical protein